MNWLTGVAVYFLIWWLVLFAVLPWGVQREENPRPGHDPGAPVQTHLWKKVSATTVLSGVIWIAIYWLIKSPWLSFRT